MIVIISPIILVSELITRRDIYNKKKEHHQIKTWDFKEKTSVKKNLTKIIAQKKDISTSKTVKLIISILFFNKIINNSRNMQHGTYIICQSKIVES